MVVKTDLVEIRGYTPEDRNFILSTWLKGARYGNSYLEKIEQEAYFKGYGRVVEAALDAPGALIAIACLLEDPTVILGYSVSNDLGRTLNYLFVKKAWRSIGIGRMLVSPEINQVTTLTEQAERILAKHFPAVTFNPYESE